MWWMMAVSLAATPDEVVARMKEIAAVRASRLVEAPAISDDHLRTAAGGKVSTGLVTVEGHAAKKAFGVGVVAVPIARFWAAINDDVGKPKWTKLEYAEVIGGQACGPARRVFQYLPVGVPLMSDRWWIADIKANTALSEATAGRVREMTWQNSADQSMTPSAQGWADKGIPVPFSVGSWFLVDLDGKSTVVEYYAWSDPGGSIPAGMASSFAAGGIADTLSQMAKAALAGPACPY